MRQFIRLTACLLCVLLFCSCGGRGEPDSSAAESSAESGGSQSAATIESEPDPDELREQELEKTMDKIARDFAAALPSGSPEKIAAAMHWTPENLQYFQNVSIESATAEPTGQLGFYRLTLAVSEPGPTLLMTGTNTYVMQVGYPSFGGDDGPTVLCVANEKQYRTFDEIDADSAMLQVLIMRSWSNFGEFQNPQQIGMARLMDYLIIIASFDARVLGAEQYEFTQDEINAVAKKYFGFPGFEFQSAKEYDKATGKYILIGRGGSPMNERIINRVDADGGIAEVYVEEFSDPLQLMMTQILCYRLSPNDDGSWRFLSCEKVKLD